MVRRLRSIAFLGIAASLIAGTAFAQTAKPVNPANSGKIAVLRALDKVAAEHVDLQIPVGDTVRFGNLRITVDYCRSRPPEEQPESFILLKVTDNSPDRDEKQAFEGWMLASQPALNSLEHPVYGLWAIDCLMEIPAETSTEASADQTDD